MCVLNEEYDEGLIWVCKNQKSVVHLALAAVVNKATTTMPIGTISNNIWKTNCYGRYLTPLLLLPGQHNSGQRGCVPDE